MPALVSEERESGCALAEPERYLRSRVVPEPEAQVVPRSARGRTAEDKRPEIAPNALVRWAFYLSVFSIPFTRLYIPGTGERVGVIRLVQLLLICAVASQPRICLRFVPVSLVWILAYCVVRISSGLWFSLDLWDTWWPKTFDWLQFSLPWVWILFNLVQYPKIQRGGLWALVWGCCLCALLHIADVGATTVESSRHDILLEEIRSTVFEENANVVGANYATAIVILIGLGMYRDARLSHRLLLLPLIGLVGTGLAKTGSRTAALMVGMGVLVLLLQAESFSSRVRRYSTLVLIAAILAGILWQAPTVMERFKDLDTQDIGKANPRARMAPVLWEMFLRSPIYGSGPDQYEMELTRRAMPYLLRDGRTIVAHNLALLLLVETGLIGFLIFSTGLCKALAAAWRARLRPCGLLPLALLVPFFVSGILLSNPSSNHMFWFTIAYALAGAV